MEVEQSPTPVMRTPSNKIIHRRCSERYCSTIGGNMCDQCIAAMRARAFSNVKTTTTGEVVLKRPDPTLLKELPIFRDLGTEIVKKDIPSSVRPGIIYNTMPKLPLRSNSLRPYIGVTRRAGHIGPMSPERNQPIIVNHFNSRGELVLDTFSSLDSKSLNVDHAPTSNPREAISRPCTHVVDGDSCPTCSATISIPTVSSAEGRPTQATISGSKDILPINLDVNKFNIDTEGNMDLDDLELAYPEVPGNKAESENPPMKRQKLSHPVIDLTHSSLAATSNPTLVQATSANVNLKLDKSSKNASYCNRNIADHSYSSTSFAKPVRSLKLCSTSDCTGIVSSGSFANRCLSCVRRQWKVKKEGPRQPPASKNVEESMSSTSSASEVSELPKGVKKKGVTWADEISSSCSPAPDLGQIDATSDKHVAVSEAWDPCDESLNSSSLVLEDYLNLDGLVEAESSGSEIPTALNHRTSRPIPSVASDSPSFPAGKPDDPKLISGWDSDLSDITDSPDGDSDSGSSSEREDKLSLPSIPSGLKIRIPARPAGTYSIKCASHKCSQLLSTGYRWKSCVMCRARSRDCQRKKQNVPVPLRLEDELMNVQNLGTPLAVQDANKDKEATQLVLGARLCAIRTCTFVIPPVGEYRWKMCSLCRLRRRERRKQEKVADRTTSPFTSEPLNSLRRKTVVADSNFMLRSLDFLCKSNSTDGSGRCRSLDCGMLLASSSSQDCRQCIARRLWLVNRSPSRNNQPEGPKLLHRGSKTPLERPRGPAPYPRFRCFSAVLFEFKNRLAGFLRAQSIFFLFNKPRSANALFAFDGEYSIVALDYDIARRRAEVDANVLKLKKEIEYVGRIKFSPKRLVSTLEEGGIAVRFSCLYPVPMMQPKKTDSKTSINTFAKTMQCELEIAVLPDYSHRFIPGQRTIIRFRLFG